MSIWSLSYSFVTYAVFRYFFDHSVMEDGPEDKRGKKKNVFEVCFDLQEKVRPMYFCSLVRLILE